MSEGRLYVYKCIVDDGGAPCVDGGALLTLTICKPYIRSTAKQGDWIFAFGANDEAPPNRLIYIAEVGDVLRGGSYFEDPNYQKRSDCIYERTTTRALRRRADARFHEHPGAMASDIGPAPDYPKANTILSSNFRYFGKAGTDGWKPRAPMLKEMVESLGQGHRVNLTENLRRELENLRSRVWRDHPSKKTLGKPLHSASVGCRDTEDEVVKVCRQRCYYVSERRSC